MNEKIGDRIITREGMATADNDRFLRLWNEVNIDSIGFHIESTEEAVISQKNGFHITRVENIGSGMEIRITLLTGKMMVLK